MSLVTVATTSMPTGRSDISVPISTKMLYLPRPRHPLDLGLPQAQARRPQRALIVQIPFLQRTFYTRQYSHGAFLFC